MSERKFYPLRPIQRLFIDTHFNRAKSTMMNVGALFKLSPVVDMDKLVDAVNETLEAHDIFHCRLVIHPDTQDICQVFDGEITPATIEKTSDEEFELLRKKLLKQPYRLIDKPLYHITLVETPTSKYLYLDFYQSIIDGASISILFIREINMRYNGRYLPEKFPSYADFVESEENISPAELEKGHEYWRNLLSKFNREKNIPPIDVRTIKLWTKGEIKLKFKNISEEFFRKTRRSETTFFLAVFMMSLAKFCKSKNIYMRLLHSGRSNPNERRVMGLMFDNFPCVWDFEQDMTVEDFLNEFEGNIQTGFSYKRSLDIVYNEGLADDCPSFVFQKNIFNDHAVIGDSTAVIIDMPPNELSATPNSLDLRVFSKEDGLYEFWLIYDAGRFGRNSMKNFVAIIEKVLTAMQNPNNTTSKIWNSIRG